MKTVVGTGLLGELGILRYWNFTFLTLCFRPTACITLTISLGERYRWYNCNETRWAPSRVRVTDPRVRYLLSSLALIDWWLMYCN